MTALLIMLLPLCVLAQTAQSGGDNVVPASGQLSVIIEQVHARPTDAETLTKARVIAFALLARQRYEDAWSIFRAVLDVSPRDQKALYGGALALFNLKQIKQAESLARAALSATGVDLNARERPGDKADAEANVRASDALVLLGVILAVEKDNAGALKAVEQAVALAPGNFDAHYALGRARYGAGDPAGAAKAFRAASALRPVDAKARFFLATSLEDAGDSEGALAAYRELLLVQPDSAEGHLGLGVLLVKLGGEGTAEGMSELARAIALNGDLYEARVTLGRTLVRMGRAAESIEHLRRAALLAPQNPEPHYQLALAYRRLGRNAEAAQETAIVQNIHSARRGEN
ncbi:MAG TPA: tetratricopeptide repeat protein [Pyrinomonadaceae bacterium]|nr:tetratricopeptide repeat protein [Pyrinomonadaceae bacterium]